MTDIQAHNRNAWNAEARGGESPWCQPVTAATIAAARQGRWSVVLTPNIAVPESWFDGVRGKRVLCLASGGGQQAPVLAAAGAQVTSFDIADEQLALDTKVAARDGLDIEIVRGDMSDLSCLDSASFDLVFHPVSNVFVPDVRVIWRECHRVLAGSGRLLAGFMNPDYFMFDLDAMEAGEPPALRYRLPFAAMRDLDERTLRQRLQTNSALEFSHSLDDQIGGQITAGFLIAGLYEDRWSDAATPLNAYMATSIATLAIKAL